ncbi:MAG: zinc ribbon domain-containing protein [Muricomes sp.]
MNKLQTKIMNMDFKKAARRFILLSLAVILLGGALTGFMFRTQIGEAASYHQNYENGRENEAWKDNSEEWKDNSEDARHDGENYGEPEERERGHERGEADFFETGQFTMPTVGEILVFATYVSLCALITLTYWLLVMVWLYQAASKADMNKLLWTLLGLFFNFLAVIAFLIVRSRQMFCSNCGIYQKSGIFCRACGAPLQIKCAECGALVDRKDTYCSHCGKKITHNGTDKEE